MHDLEQGRWMATSKPGSVILSLAEAGILHLPDLYANPEAFGWIGRQDWVFRTHFETTDLHCLSEQAELILNGLDTITQIWVNEKLVGKTESMFIAHRFDVKPWIRPGRNTLMIKFASAIDYAELLIKRYGSLGEQPFGDPRRAYLRKAQYQFGSAMGPELLDCGVTGTIGLECFSQADIDNIHIRTIDCNLSCADMRIAVSIRDFRSDARNPLSCTLTIRGNDFKQVHTLTFDSRQNSLAAVIRIENPSLWQPKGYGDANLYSLTAEIVDGDRLLDTQEMSFGIRSIRIMKGQETDTSDFGIEVNGQVVYLKGANWLPTSLFSEISNADKKRQLLNTLSDANINMLRVWGGGIYEDDDFYHECDKLGILVWQDFMFASAYYPDGEWFAEHIRLEAQSVIRRLRNHPCLAVWCGNSHIDRLHQTGQLGKSKKFHGKAIFHRLLPEMLAELDPNRDYIPTVPESLSEDKSSAFADLWHLWNQYVPIDTMTTNPIPPLIVEAGFQSLPDIETLAMTCPRESMAASSAAVEKQNYHTDGPQRLAHFSAEYFPPPKSIEQQIYQSQIIQARTMKKTAETLRANNHLNHGLLLWSANDFWPGAGFSMIDYRSIPKALYFYARRFFAPVLICFAPIRRDSSMPDKSIIVINDSGEPLAAQVVIEQLDMKGRVVDSSTYPITVSPFSRTTLRTPAREFILPVCPEKTLLRLAVLRDSTILSENVYLYEPDKYLEYRPLNIDIEVVQRDEKTLSYQLESRSFVKDLQIVLDETATLSDNFIDLLPNRTYEIIAKFANPAPCITHPIILRSACVL
jgi:beta-mannosidase